VTALAHVQRLRRLWQARPRWTSRLVLLALALVVAVLLLTNLAMWLRVVPRLANSEGATISYGFAWSPWPTRLRVHDLLITGQDHNVQYAIGLDEGWLTVELWALVAHRTVKITKLRGSGASVRVVQRLLASEVTDAKVLALPDIPGYSKPPLFVPYIRSPNATELGYDRISIEVKDIDATVRELWVDDIRFEGLIRARGSFLVRPGLQLHLRPDARADIIDGRLSIGGIPMLTATTGRANASTPAFNPIEPDGWAILAFFSGSAEVKATLVSAQFANPWLSSSGLQLQGGAGRLSLALELVRGVVRPASTLTLYSNALTAQADALRLATSLQVHALVDDTLRASVKVTAEQLVVDFPDSKAALSGGPLSAELSTKLPLDFSEPFPALSYVISIASLGGELTAVAPYLPPSLPLTIERGSVSLQGDLGGTVGLDDLTAHLLLKSDLALHSAGRRLAGSLSLLGKVRQSGQRWELAGTTLEVHDLMVAQGKSALYGWWTTAAITDGGFVNDASPRLEVRLRGQLRDVEPLFVAYAEQLSIPGWVQSLLPLTGLRWTGYLAVEAGAFALSNLRGTTETVVIRLKVVKPAHTNARGALKLEAQPLSYGVAFGRGSSSTRIMATDAWFEEQE
jgi:hypothetical protein